MTPLRASVPATPWQPRPAIRLSAWAHATATIAVAAQPELWPAALGAVALNHALLGGLGLWPSSLLLGQTLCRLPEPAAGRVALTFDDGPDPETTPRVLDLLARHGARATFFCIGARAERHPALVRAMLAAGHAVGNHTMHHPYGFAARTLRGQRAEVAAAQAVLAGTGPVPTLFRAPAGLRSPLTDPVLHEFGLTHVSWTRRACDTRIADPARVLRRLTVGLAGGDILLLHDGNAARDADGVPVVLPALAALLPLLAARGLSPVALSAPATAPVAMPAAAAAAGSRA